VAIATWIAIALAGDGHHFGTAPGDRPDIGVFLPIRLQHERLGGVEFGDAEGNSKSSNSADRRNRCECSVDLK
jgi:hypothetical protein